ncbi:g6421 [Coccomyxa elongata]
MASHLIETSEEDSFLAVARYIGDLLAEGQTYTALADTPGTNFSTKCEALLAAGEYSKLLDQFVAQIELLFNKISDKADLDCCLDIVVLTVPRIPEGEWASAAAKVTTAVTSQVDSHAEKRLSCLTDLFNAIPDATVQYSVLLDTLSYAKKANLVGLLAPVVKASAEEWAKEWKLNVADQRTLFFACADILRLSKKKKAGPLDAYKLTLKALSTFQGANTAELAAVKDVAAEAVADFIRFPELFQFDLLEAEAVAQLHNDKQHGPLHELLTMLLTSSNVKGLEAFSKQHGDVLKSVGVSYEDILAKGRILALLSLASQSQVLSFAAIRESLALEEGQEEAFVIRASGNKLLEARIDQLRRVVTVSKIAHQTFTSAQWEQLRGQLAAWKENVWSVKDLVNTQKDDGLSRGVPTSAPVRA